MRMLMNNLDPEVAERPADLVVYGGIGRAARDWESYDKHRRNADAPGIGDETLLVQSGKPVGVFRTHAGRPARSHCQFEPRPPLGDVGTLLTNSTAGG